jgi:hypothetical protein
MYNLLTERPFMPEIINENNILSFLRSNAQYNELIFNVFNASNKIYYFHYIDGDNWNNAECWVNGHKENITIPNILYEMSTYKDCIFKYADEFVLIDFVNHTEEIKNMNDTHDEKVTTVIYECNNTDYTTMRNKAKIDMWKSKNIKRGEIYAFN